MAGFVLQVWKIEDFLAKWEGACSTGSASSSAMAADPAKAAIALVLLKEIDSYRCVDSPVLRQPAAK